MNTIQTFFRDKTVLITGASSGIGEELAIQLGQAGAKLMLTARRKDLLEIATAEERRVSQTSELLLRTAVHGYRKEGSGYLQRFLSRQKKEET